MNETVDKILTRIMQLENELEDELTKRASELRYRISNGRIVFEQEVRARHAAFKIGVFRYIGKARWLVILTAPIIYSLIIPFVLLDIFVTIYQRICFPIYGIPLVKRSHFMMFDRMKLDYLNAIEKFNCAYCSYGNGVIAYVREVAARTEQYWCPIKHALRRRGAHDRYYLFSDYGDAEHYRDNLKELKARMKNE